MRSSYLFFAYFFAVVFTSCAASPSPTATSAPETSYYIGYVYLFSPQKTLISSHRACVARTQHPTSKRITEEVFWDDQPPTHHITHLHPNPDQPSVYAVQSQDDPTLQGNVTYATPHRWTYDITMQGGVRLDGRGRSTQGGGFRTQKTVTGPNGHVFTALVEIFVPTTRTHFAHWSKQPTPWTGLDETLKRHNLPKPHDVTLEP